MELKRDLLAGLGLMSLIAAQAPATQRPMDDTDRGHATTAELPKSMSLKKFMGGEVRLRPSDEKLRDAAEEGDVAKAPTASIEDLVLSTGGEVEWAALSVGGLLGIGDRVVLVPVDKIRTSLVEDKVRCTLGMTEAELERLPEFKRDEVKGAGKLDSAVAVVEAGFRTDKGRMDGKVTESSEDGMRHYMLGSELLDSELHASDEKFASVTNAVIDPRTHCVDHLIVSHGGLAGVGDTLYLVPTEAVRLTRADDECKLMVPKTVAELEKGVKYEKPEDSFVNASDLERADRFFGVDPMARKAKRDEHGEMRHGDTGSARAKKQSGQ